MQNQSAQWLDIRRDKPDFLVMWGWGAMVPTAVKEAVKAEFPMDKFIAIWWTNDTDAAAGSDGAKGFKMVSWHRVGARLSGLRRHQEAGHRRRQEPDAEPPNSARSSTIVASTMRCSSPRRSPRRKRSLARRSLTARTFAAASKTSNIDAARLKAIGLDGFAGPFKTTCFDHNSHSATFVQQWDGAKWVKVSDLITPDSAKVEAR